MIFQKTNNLVVVSQPFIKKPQQFFLLLGLELQFYFFFCEIENIPKTTSASFGR